MNALAYELVYLLGLDGEFGVVCRGNVGVGGSCLWVKQMVATVSEQLFHCEFFMSHARHSCACCCWGSCCSQEGGGRGSAGAEGRVPWHEAGK